MDNHHNSCKGSQRHGFPLVSDKERMMREVALRRAEKVYTAGEFADLLADMSNNRVEVRVYDDGVCLTRTFA